MTFSENIPFVPRGNRIKVDIGTAVITRHTSLCTPGHWRVSIPLCVPILNFLQGSPITCWDADAVMDDFGNLVKVQP